MFLLRVHRDHKALREAEETQAQREKREIQAPVDQLAPPEMMALL